jgi:hypothetical protein
LISKILIKKYFFCNLKLQNEITAKKLFCSVLLSKIIISNTNIKYFSNY